MHVVYTMVCKIVIVLPDEDIYWRAVSLCKVNWFVLNVWWWIQDSLFSRMASLPINLSHSQIVMIMKMDSCGLIRENEHVKHLYIKIESRLTCTVSRWTVSFYSKPSPTNLPALSLVHVGGKIENYF